MAVSFSSSTYCIITGASRGYGQCLAVSFAETFCGGGAPHVDLVLTARNRGGEEACDRLSSILCNSQLASYLVFRLITFHEK
jgi:short-subunit dehydrogenase